jgi:hypothetical protein
MHIGRGYAVVAFREQRHLFCSGQSPGQGLKRLLHLYGMCGGVHIELNADAIENAGAAAQDAVLGFRAQHRAI